MPLDILLLIEAADTSLHYVREAKLPMYARSGLNDVWVLNLNLETVEIYRQPSVAGFEAHLVMHRGESIAPVAFPEIIIAFEDIYG